MAGINVEKYHSATEAKNVLCHCDKYERQKHEHDNKQIDKNKTDNNFQIGLKSYKKNYKSVCNEYDRRISEIDSKAAKAARKDRVTLVGMELPRPLELSPEQFQDWSMDVMGIFIKFYGSDCILCGYGHVDEVHEYKKFNESTQKAESATSREHLHVFLTPYSHDRQSLCAKNFTNRQNLIELNKLVDEMSVSKYHVNFCDGTKRKSKKSVEELKNESRLLEQTEKDREIKRLQSENDRLREENQRLRNELQLSKSSKSERELPDLSNIYSSSDYDFSR